MRLLTRLRVVSQMWDGTIRVASTLAEKEGRALVNWPFLNDDLDAVATMLRHPHTVMGLADAGAHVGLIMDASQPTFLLSYWVRERGLLPIGEAIRQMADGSFAGLYDHPEGG